MSWSHPWLLLLLLAVPPLVFLRHARRRRAVIRFSDGEVLARLPLSWAVALHQFLPVLHAVGLVLVVVALARPQRGVAESRVKTQGVDIVLLMDVSTSMRAVDLSTGAREINRLDAAKQVIEKFIKKRGDDRIGLVAFAAQPYSAAPLTLDHGWLLSRMAQIETGMLEDGTAIGTAIASAVNRLRGSEAKSKLVVLLTDGSNNAGELTPDNAAQAAKALGIRIYTVGAGASGVVAVPTTDPFGRKVYMRQQSDIDDALLTRVATATGGRYFRAADLETLTKVYDEIDRLEKTEIEVHQYTRYEELFAPFLLAALLALGVEKLLGLTRLGRLPS
jgi:Ca-activated chloride channel family protein